MAHIVGADLGFHVVVKYALDGHRLDDGRPSKISDEAWDAIACLDETAQHALMDGTIENLQAFHHTLRERILREFADMQEDGLEQLSVF